MCGHLGMRGRTKKCLSVAPIHLLFLCPFTLSFMSRHHKALRTLYWTEGYIMSLLSILVPKYCIRLVNGFTLIYLQKQTNLRVLLFKKIKSNHYSIEESPLLAILVQNNTLKN